MVFVSLTAVAWAQSAPIYNSKNSSYTYGGPINLQQILEGNDLAATGSKSQYYGSSSSYYGGQSYRPYGLSDPGSSGLSVTPDDVLRARAQRDREARARERENMDALAAFNREMKEFEQGQNLQQNVSQQSNGVSPVQRSGRRVYDKNERDRLNKPRKVFNSLR